MDSAVVNDDRLFSRRIVVPYLCATVPHYVAEHVRTEHVSERTRRNYTLLYSTILYSRHDATLLPVVY